jgi:ATP-dependent Zn protease
MRNLLLAVTGLTAILALPAAAAPNAECKAHLLDSLKSMSAGRFAEELAGAEGMAGNASATTRNAAIMITDLYARTQDREAQIAALKSQVVRVQSVAARLEHLRSSDPTNKSFIDLSAEGSLRTLEDNLTARVTLVGATLEAERAALDADLALHCTPDGAAASASAH